MSKQDYCIHFVDLSHLGMYEMRDAARWCFNTFGYESVDVMRPISQDVSLENGFPKKGFWFGREKDATMCRLMWG